MKKNILILSGGRSSEHEISIVSANYLKQSIDTNLFNIKSVLIGKDSVWRDEKEEECFLDFKKKLISKTEETSIDIVIPCIHGYPGETGDIQSYFEMINLPYFGCESEPSKICFNKITTKLWLDKFDIPNTPYIFIAEENESNTKRALSFFKEHGPVFIKASNQGSSVGCYQGNTEEEIKTYLHDAFNYSPFVLIEKLVKGRELEVSAFEYKSEVHATAPGEIICPDKFYSYEEKYNPKSKTTTDIKAQGLSENQIKEIREIAIKSFKSLKLRHLSRIDFFLTTEGEISLNEINTFPGMTPISMFPKMMENYGIHFKDFLNENLKMMVNK